MKSELKLVAFLFMLILFQCCRKEDDTFKNINGLWVNDLDTLMTEFTIDKTTYEIKNYYTGDYSGIQVLEGNYHIGDAYNFQITSGNITSDEDSLYFSINSFYLDPGFVIYRRIGDETITYNRGTTNFENFFGNMSDYALKYELNENTLKVFIGESEYIYIRKF